MNGQGLLRFAITLLVFAAAIWLGNDLWQRYMHSPWTRDGRVKADVVTIAPDVSGIVTTVAVKDNQSVHKGDLLFSIDHERYRLALAQADAIVAARKVELSSKRDDVARRADLGGVVISEENLSNTTAQALAAAAQYQEALSARDTAKLNLARTEIRAPVDGYITNLDIHPGDYASTGKPVLAVVDSHSFWVYGYFEETKLPLVYVGDPAIVRLMAGGTELRGHVDSISHGITDRDNATGRELLADVNPTFSWVRLAQRIPVRIQLDEVPQDVELAAGMTATVIIEPRQQKPPGASLAH